MLATVPLWLRDQYFLHVLIMTGIFIIAAMSLNLLLGYTGQLSLGHVAFFGIGAYASALTTLGFDVELPGGFTVVHAPWPAVVGFFMAVVIAGLSGYAIGRLSFKVRGAYFVIVTISFAEVTRLVALNWVELTQGPLALTNIPPFTLWIPGLGEYAFWGKTAYYYLVAVVGLLAYVIISRLVNSRIGRAMIALRENEPLASSVGIDVTRYLVLAAVVSAAMAGAAGSLYAHYVRIIDPDIFLFIYTVTMVIMVITGGKGTLAGPIVGGVIFGFLPVIVRPFAAPAVQWIVYGVLMIVIVFVLPQGIVPAIERWAANWRRPRAASDAVGLGRPESARRVTAQADIVLSIEHVAVHFGGLVAISDLNFAVREGEIVGLIGPNGAGKTTAFNVITGFLKPTSGDVRYRTTSLVRPQAARDRRAWPGADVPAHERIPEQQRVRERADRLARSRALHVVGYAARAAAREPSEQELVHDATRDPAIRRSGAAGAGARRHPALRRAASARHRAGAGGEAVDAAAGRAGIRDERVRDREVMKLVEKIRASGVTILLVEHDMPMVMKVSDRIVVLNYGRIIAEGPPAEIQNNPEVIRAYLGQGKKRA